MNELRTLVSDTFALPRDAEHAIHGLVGMWESRHVYTWEAFVRLLHSGWKASYVGPNYIVMRYTYWERCGCGREAHHG